MATTSASFQPLLEDAVQSLVDLYGRQGELTGVSSGYRALDRATGGLIRGSVTMVVGPPGAGKTLLGLHMAVAAATAGLPTRYFTLRDAPELLAQRIVLGESGISRQHFTDGIVPMAAWERITGTVAQLCHAPLQVIRVGAVEELPAEPSPDGVVLIDGLFSRGKERANRRLMDWLVRYAQDTGQVVVALLAGPGGRDRIPQAMLPFFLGAELALVLRAGGGEITVESVVNRSGLAFAFRVCSVTGHELAEEVDTE